MTDGQLKEEELDERFSEKELQTGVPTLKKLKKYIFSILFMVVLMVVTFYIIFKDNSVSDIMSVLFGANLWWVLAGFGAILVCRTMQSTVMIMSARCIGYKLTWGEAAQYSLVNVFYSGITPSATGGQPMQLFYLCRDKMSVSGATLVVFTVNITFQIAMVVLSLGSLAYLWKYVAATASGLFALFGLGVAMHCGLLLLLATVMFSKNNLRRIVSFGMKLGMKLHLIKNEEKARRNIDKYISEVKLGEALIKAHPWKFIAIFFVTVLQVCAYHMVPFFVFKAFGMTTDFSLPDIFAISAFLYVAVSFLPLPGTVGAAERGFVILYRAVFPGHVLAATLLTRFISFYIILLFAGLASIYVQIRKPHNIAARKCTGCGRRQ
jgi:uncharacterized protein (TIRG00374 family)